MNQAQDFINQIGKELGIPAERVKPLTEKEYQTVYASASSLYEQGSYEEASQLFTQLALNAPFCEAYWRGLAACRQMQGSYEASLHAWALTALLQEHDPLPHFHAAECYLSLNDKEEGLKALDAAKSLLNTSAEHQELGEKIAILRKTYGTPH